MLAIALIGFAVLALRMWALGLGLPSWLHPDEYRVLFFCSTSTAAISIRFFYLSDIPLLSAGPGLSSLFPVAEYFRATAQLRFSYRDESINARYRRPASRSPSVAGLRLETSGPGGEAIEHARADIRLSPEGGSAVELKRWLQDGNIHPEK
jgi:hypothetical protein